MPARLPDAIRRRALDLLDQGWSLRAIGRELDVHHSTVMWWRDGGADGAGTGGHPRGSRRAPLADWEQADDRQRDAWAYLLGIYLGDGYIDPLGRLRISCDAAYPGIIDEVVAALRRLGVERPWLLRQPGCWVVAAGDDAWAELLPTGRGPKHTYEIRLVGWQEEACESRPHLVVRGLIQSDGCRFLNTVISRAGVTHRYPTYDFTNRSSDLHAVLRACLGRLGVAWRSASRERITRVARREAVGVMDLFVGSKR